jgi:hypothetical protein
MLVCNAEEVKHKTYMLRAVGMCLTTFWSTHTIKYFSFLSTSVTIDYNRCLGKGEVSTMLDLSGLLIFRSLTVTSSLVRDSEHCLIYTRQILIYLINYSVEQSFS